MANELTFSTGSVIPTLTTTGVTGITGSTATGGGNITSDGGASVKPGEYAGTLLQVQQ